MYVSVDDDYEVAAAGEIFGVLKDVDDCNSSLTNFCGIVIG